MSETFTLPENLENLPLLKKILDRPGKGFLLCTAYFPEKKN